MSVTTVRLQLEVESHFAAIASKLYSQKIAGMHICIAAHLKEDFVINEKYSSTSTRRKPWVLIGVTASILILLGLVLSAMPKGFKGTHEQIGTGKPAVVFIYDTNLSVSVSQTEQMNKARDQLDEHAFFLVAQLNTPEGDQLIAKHGAHPAELLLFDPSGKLIKRQFALQNERQLIEWMGFRN